MKRLIATLILTTIAALAFSQDGQALYGALSESVVYLQHGIRINSEDSTQAALWKRFEQLLKKPFLNEVIPVQSGSGFFVDDDGMIITNRHVVKLRSLDVVRYSEVQSLSAALDDYYASNFTAEERDAMKEDFKAMIEKGAYSFEAMLGAKNLGPVTVLAQSDAEKEDEPDLALAKIEGGPYKGIKLASAEAIGPALAGSDVFSFGYPLGSYLDVLFKERTVTMNKGLVSAIRKTALGIQHSAAISHGNSGGPLVNKLGQVVGVNTASLQEREGNSLFYATDVQKIFDFLNQKGYAQLIKWNLRLPPSLPASSDLKSAQAPERLPLVIDSNPSGATVIADGKTLGTTPLKLVLSPDTYVIHLRQDNKWYTDIAAEVRAGQNNDLSFGSEIAYPVAFKALPADPGAKAQFSSNRGKVSYAVGESVFLPKGAWTLNLSGSEAFDGVSVPFQVQGDTTVDLSPFKKIGALKIAGLDPKAKLWIDDKPFPNTSGPTLQIPLGPHSVYVWEDWLQPMEKTTVNVRADGKSFVTWDRLFGHDASAAWLGWSGAGAGLAGAALAGLGYYYGQNSLIVVKTASYSDYTSQKTLANAEAFGGFILVGAALIVEAVALDHGKKLKAQRLQKASLEAQK